MVTFRGSTWRLTTGVALLTGFVACAAALRSITEHPRLFQLAYLAGFLGYALLVRDWLADDSPRPKQRFKWWLAYCGAVRLALVFCTPTDDAFRYVWEGRIQAAGFNPYRVSPLDPDLADLRDENWTHINHPSYPAIYFPLAQLEFRTVTAFAASIQAVKAAHVAADLACVAILAAWLRRKNVPAERALVYGLNPLTLTAFAAEGHVDSLMLAGIALMGWGLTQRRPLMAAACGTAAMLVKPVAIIALPWLFRDTVRGALRRLGLAPPTTVANREGAASAIGASGGPTATAPSAARPTPQWGCALVIVITTAAVSLPYLGAGFDLFTGLRRFVGRTEFFGFVFHGLSRAAGPTAARIVVAVAFAVGAAYLLAKERDFSNYCGAIFGLLIVLMPIVHYWYLTWVLLVVCFRPRVSWLVLSASMVFYFDAWVGKTDTAAWEMPAGTRFAVYVPFVIAWTVEMVIRRRARRQSGGGESP